MIGLIRTKYQSFRNLKKEQRAVLILTAAVFFPFFVFTETYIRGLFLPMREEISGIIRMLPAGLFILYAVGVGLFSTDIRRRMFSGTAPYFAAAAALVAIVPPLFSKNLLGFFGGIVIAILMLLSLFLRRVMTRALFSKVIDLCCFGSIVSFIVAFFQNLYLEPIFVEKTYHTFRSDSTFFNANYYGYIISLVVIMALYKLLEGKDHKLFYLITLAANLGGLCLCGTRAAWASIAIGSLFLTIFLKRYKAVAFALSLLLITIVLLMYFPNIIPRWLDFSRTVGIRYKIWDTALEGLLWHPFFGQGLWAYQLIYPQVTGGYPQFHAHNLFLDFILDFGFIGSLIFTTYFVQPLHRCIKAQNKETALLFACIIATLIFGITDVQVLAVQPAMLIMLLFSAVEIKNDDAVQQLNP